MSFFGAPSNNTNNATGTNNIPAPASDDDKNVPPPDAATRIADFVRVSGFAGEASWRGGACWASLVCAE